MALVSYSTGKEGAEGRKEGRKEGKKEGRKEGRKGGREGGKTRNGELLFAVHLGRVLCSTYIIAVRTAKKKKNLRYGSIDINVFGLLE